MAHRCERKALAIIEKRGEGCAKGDAIVGSSRLDEEIIDDARSDEFAIGFGIESDTAGEAKIVAAVFSWRGEQRSSWLVRTGPERRRRYFCGDRRCHFRERAARREWKAIRRNRQRCRCQSGDECSLCREFCEIEKRAKVDAGLSIRREAHHFPFIGVRREAEEFGEARIKQAKRIGPVDGLNVFDTTIAAAPDGGGFPSAAAVHDDDSGIVESGIGIGAKGVGKMVIDETEARFGGSEVAGKRIGAAALVPHAGEMARGIEDVEIGDGPLRGGKRLQIVTIGGRGQLPADADFINLIGAQLWQNRGRLEWRGRENGIVFEAADALFGYGETKLAIADVASGGVVRLGMVKPRTNMPEAYAANILPQTWWGEAWNMN